MNFYIQQSIQINLLKIGSITNSSVVQIGSTGVIRPTAHLFNTGGFIKPAPDAKKASIGDSLTVPAVPISIS